MKLAEFVIYCNNYEFDDIMMSCRHDHVEE